MREHENIKNKIEECQAILNKIDNQELDPENNKTFYELDNSLKNYQA